MVAVLLENGFEESEVIVPVDLLRRGKCDVRLVGIGGECVKSSRGVKLGTDCRLAEVDPTQLELLFLPGGQPGVNRLWENPEVRTFVQAAYGAGITLGAICAAPIILGRLGMLEGKRATCYPGCQSELRGALYSDEDVVCDGKMITGRAAGAAFPFGMALLRALRGDTVAREVADSVCYED